MSYNDEDILGVETPYHQSFRENSHKEMTLMVPEHPPLESHARSIDRAVQAAAAKVSGDWVDGDDWLAGMEGEDASDGYEMEGEDAADGEVEEFISGVLTDDQIAETLGELPPGEPPPVELASFVTTDPIMPTANVGDAVMDALRSDPALAGELAGYETSSVTPEWVSGVDTEPAAVAEFRKIATSLEGMMDFTVDGDVLGMDEFAGHPWAGSCGIL